MAKGKIILIGGEETNPLVFKQLFSLSENTEIKLAVITAYNSDFEAFKCKTEAFFSNETGLNIENIAVAQASSTAENFDLLIYHDTWNDKDLHNEIAEKIKHCNFVLLIGSTIQEYLNALHKLNEESSVLSAIDNIFQNNGIVAALGSAAGVLTEFNFLNDIAVDTDTDVRGRFNRLSEAAIAEGKKFAIGLNEKTAVAFTGNQLMNVIGYGDVLITDLQNANVISSEHEQFHVRNILVHMLSHGDAFDLSSGVFTPFDKKENIKNTPYFDFNDYHISLNVFKDYSTSHILVNYMLDNEAKDVVAIMDYDKTVTDGGSAMFLHYVEQDSTEVWFSKQALQQEEDEIDCYSGTNILLNIIPVNYIQKVQRPDKFNILFFGAGHDLQVIAYDTTATMPILDAKVYIFDNSGKLIYKKGTDRYGRALLKKVFNSGERFIIKVVYEHERKEQEFVFAENMPGVCLF